MNVEIRQATADDAVDVAVLLGELGYPQRPAALRSRWGAVTGDGRVVMLALAGARPVGVVSAVAVPLLAEATTLVRITALSVTASARGRGVGRALIAAVERYAQRQGADLVEVGSGRRPERAAAHRFYPVMGFVDANDTAARYIKRIGPAARSGPPSNRAS